jgi:small-conductance mechanosensitive channel
MHLRNQIALVGEFLAASFYVVIGVTGVLLVVLGLKRDDIVKPIFLVAGIALAAIGFGVQFLGWRI